MPQRAVSIKESVLESSHIRSDSLHRLFSRLVARGFDDLGVADTGLRTYAVDLLVRFARTDALYQLRAPTGRQVDTVVGMLIEAEEAKADGRGDETFRIAKHTGDFALFMSGIFRSYVERGGYLDWYLTEGPRAYRRAIQVSPDPKTSDLLEHLWRDFERGSGALDYVRKVYFGRAAVAEGLESVVRRFETWH